MSRVVGCFEPRPSPRLQSFETRREPIHGGSFSAVLALTVSNDWSLGDGLHCANLETIPLTNCSTLSGTLLEFGTGRGHYLE